MDLNYLAISTKTWNKLTPDQQKRLQAAADTSSEYGRLKQLELEDQLVSFLREKGLKVYEPDVDAFRKRAQKMYLGSDFAKTWPKGLLDKINSR